MNDCVCEDLHNRTLTQTTKRINKYPNRYVFDKMNMCMNVY